MADRRDRLLIVGAGGHAKVILDAARKSHAFERLALLDENPANWGKRISGIEIVGGQELLSRLDSRLWQAIVAVGDNVIRRRLVARVEEAGWRFARVVHPSAQIGEDVEIGDGAVVLARVVINSAAHIGRHAIVNSAAVVEHDCFVGDYAHLAPASCMAGGARLEEGALLGLRATVLPGRTVGAWAVAGAGAVVTRDLSANALATGMPARPVDAETAGDTERAGRRSHDTTRLRVAVSGAGGGVGQAVLRALDRSTLDPWVLGLDMGPYGAGMYMTDEARCVLPCGDSNYIAGILSVLTEHRVSVLIPGSDPELPVLARARDEFETAGIRVIVGAPEPVDICRDKRLCSEFFRGLGFPFVRTCDIADAGRLVDDIGYPLVVKPVGGSASRGVAVVFSEAELEPFMERSDYIVQEPAFPEAWSRDSNGLAPSAVYRGGLLRQEDEISIQVLYDHLGLRLATYTSVNRLQNGVPVFVDPQRVPEVESVVEAMADVLRDRGLIGPCNFQCRLTSEGPKVFEINPRFTGITGVRAAMGFNEVDAVLHRLTLDVPVDVVRSGLVQPTDRLSMRYVDELIVARRRFEEMCG